MLRQLLSLNTHIVSLRVKLIKTKSEYHMQCRTELGLNRVFTSLIESDERQ